MLINMFCKGVEFAAELRDFVGKEISKLYPRLIDKIKLTLIGGYRGVLSTYDEEVFDCHKLLIHNSLIVLPRESLLPHSQESTNKVLSVQNFKIARKEKNT